MERLLPVDNFEETDIEPGVVLPVTYRHAGEIRERYAYEVIGLNWEADGLKVEVMELLPAQRRVTFPLHNIARRRSLGGLTFGQPEKWSPEQKEASLKSQS